MNKNDKDTRRDYFHKGLTAFCVIAAAIVFFFLFLRLGDITGFLGKTINVLQPVIMGLVIAYLINPVVNFLNARLIPFFRKRMKNGKSAVKLSNSLSVFAAEILFCVIVFGFMALIIPQFAISVADIVKTLPGKMTEYGRKGLKFVQSNATLKEIYERAIEYGEKWVKEDLSSFATKLGSSVASGVLDVANFLKNFVIGIVFSIYLMFSKRTFVNQTKKVFYAVFDDKTVSKIFSWFATVHKIFSGFINGKLIDSLIIGVLCFIGTSILGIPYALLISCIIGVTNIIPVFGPWIGGIPSTILVLLVNPLKGLYLGIFIILLQTLDGNILGPKILGNRIGLNTFWVVFAIVLGGGLFGVLGMLIGVPGFAIIYYVAATLVNYLLRKKNKSTNSADYYNSNGDLKPEENKETKEETDGGEALAQEENN